MRWLAIALASIALAGCESTQEKSARLEKIAHARHSAVVAQVPKITRVSSKIKALSVTGLHGSEGNAVAVVLRNAGAARQQVPLLITVAGSGAPTYTNAIAGLSRSLVSAAYVPAHSTAVWVDDQVPTAPGSVTARIGEGKPLAGAAPALVIGPHHLEAEPSGGEVLLGTVSNHSSVAQRELVVYALASRGGRVVAAGRGVVASLAGGASGKFQIFLTGGSAQGAQLTVSAPPSTL